MALFYSFEAAPLAAAAWSIANKIHLFNSYNNVVHTIQVQGIDWCTLYMQVPLCLAGGCKMEYDEIDGIMMLLYYKTYISM